MMKTCAAMGWIALVVLLGPVVPAQDSQGKITGYDVCDYDDWGLMISKVSYKGPGPDGKWFTRDDQVSYYKTYGVDAQGRIIQDASYEAGPDGRWFTDDDRATYCSRYSYNLNGKKHGEQHTIAGEDGRCDTDDDRHNYGHHYLYDKRGRLVRMTWDGKNKVNSYVRYEYDQNDQRTRLISYEGPGPDAEWYSEDDVVKYHTRYSRKSGDKGLILEYRITCKHPGRNNRWLDNDDRISDVAAYAFDQQGKEVGYFTFKNPGPDGRWLTRDDVGHYSEVYEFDDEGNKIASVFISHPGPDGKFFTADDLLERFTRYSYDERGNVLTTVRGKY